MTGKTLFWLTPVILSASFIFPACKDSNAPSSSAPTSDRRADRTTKMSDGDIENAIRAKLESDAQTRLANLLVDAEAEANKVVIKGTVPSQEARTKAIELAKSVQPGLTINDEIIVRPAG
jgi:BON domain-containing protein